MNFQDLRNGRFYNEDCFDAMKEIPDGVIDMVLCDLPYGTTQNKWDSVLQLDGLWTEYWRVCKEDAVIVLTAAQPFTSALVISQIKNFKYEWIWLKTRPVGHLNAKKMPMAAHESILIFSQKVARYNPQDLVYKPRINKRTSTKGNYGEAGKENFSEYTNYPRTTIEFDTNQSDKIHPTQKPVALFEYLIKTYTNENELVLDNTAGSGTTAIAAINTNRKWVCIEKDKDYYDKAIERIQNHGWK